MYIICTLTAIHYLNYPDLLPYWPRSSVGRALEDLIQRSWVQTPPRSNFHWPVGTPQFPLKGAIPNGDLVYRQYCLLPAPKHTFKIIISYFPGATRFPYYMIYLYLNNHEFAWRGIYLTAERAVMLVKKLTYFREFCYLNSSCIRTGIILMFLSS